MPFFSIIIPVYNVAPYLRECLDSVLAQTFTDWEAICVDDGSTDGSGAILDEYCARDRRFQVIHQDNSGVSKARNVALDNISGGWVLFLDADDVMSYLLLKILHRVLSGHTNVQMVKFSYTKFKSQYRDKELQINERDPIRYREIDISKVVEFEALDGGLWERCYNSNVCKSLRFYDICMGEDREYVNRVIESVKKIVVLDECLYYYRDREGSAVNGQMSEKKFLDHITYERRLLDVWEKSSKKYEQAIFDGFVFSITSYTDSLYRLLANPSAEVWRMWCQLMLDVSKCNFVRLKSRCKLFFTGFLKSKSLYNVIW